MTTADIHLPRQATGLSRFRRHHSCEHYYRLALIVIGVNGLIAYLAWTYWGWFTAEQSAIEPLANIVLYNFSLAIIIRQQYTINLLFKLATMTKTRAPLWLRWRLGKVYHFGGLHSGSAISGSLWFFVFCIYLLSGFFQRSQQVDTLLMTITASICSLLLLLLITTMPFVRSHWHNFFKKCHRFSGWAILGGSLWLLVLCIYLLSGFFQRSQQVDTSLIITTLSICSLLLLILITAMPFVRSRWHNSFEKCHRFGGWTVLALFYLLHWQLLAQTLEPWYQQAGSWLLIAITFSVALPWLRLKKVPIKVVKPSNHAVLVQFDYGVTPFPGSSTAISLKPFFEWHSFANIPNPSTSGFRLAISRAGDWTGRFIDNPPQHVWVKGIPTAGVANIEVLFKKVVYLATGSGIGPVLPHLLAKQVPAHLVWATRSPEATYGEELVNEILTAEPTAYIWNTQTHGKPDMVKLAYEAYQHFNAEAVIVISNQKLTRQVVYQLESRGIPSYGAIWDS